MKLQLEVDRHVGHVLRTLESRPEVAANTVIVFTSDHGEYGGSHGLRGKGASAYEEGIRVPLIVKDPRGVLTSETEQVRTQLTSSVDVAPLLLTIATGSDDWRSEPHYSHIAGRARPGEHPRRTRRRPGARTCCTRPTRPSPSSRSSRTRPTRRCTSSRVRTPEAKYATYSDWGEEGIKPLLPGEEAELYDYSQPERAHGAPQRRRRTARWRTRCAREYKRAFSRSCASRCPAVC